MADFGIGGFWDFMKPGISLIKSDLVIVMANAGTCANKEIPKSKNRNQQFLTNSPSIKKPSHF